MLLHKTIARARRFCTLRPRRHRSVTPVLRGRDYRCIKDCSKLVQQRRCLDLRSWKALCFMRRRKEKSDAELTIAEFHMVCSRDRGRDVSRARLPCGGGTARLLRRTARRASSRCCGGAGAGRPGVLHGAGHGQGRRARPHQRQDRGNPARSALGAARCDCRARQRRMDHRRRPERDRALRSEDTPGTRVAPSRGHRLRQSQYPDVRQAGPRLVYRAERILRPSRPGKRTR